MTTEHHKYVLCVREHGLEEVALSDPMRMATFMLVIADALIGGFDATIEK